MTPKRVLKIFAIVFFVTFLGLMVWDAMLYSDAIEGNSITQSLVFYSHAYPIIPCFVGFFTGFLLAHLYG